MDFLADFVADTEFRKLLGRRDDADLTLAALELARDHDPYLDFGSTLGWIADRASELSGPLAGARNDDEVVATLAGCLAHTHELRGTSEAYEAAESSFLPCVIERKTGLPIALSVLYMAVAEKAGLALRGVAAPSHFLVRYDTPDEPLFIDPFHEGKVLSWRECLDWVRQTSGLSGGQAKSALEPVSTRVIVIRMLNNLKALYARQENWRACWKVQHRLLALQPASYHERRDWALTSLKSGRSSQAIDMLSACLKNCPPDERETLDEQLAEARKLQARWN